MSHAPQILLCHCVHAEIISKDVVAAVREKLKESNAAFTEVDDLCAACAMKAPLGIDPQQPLKIAACYPRAVQWLLHAAGQPLAADQTQVLNLRTLTADLVVSSLLDPKIIPNLPAKSPKDALAIAASVSAQAVPAQDPAWLPWFPVIDYDRCTQCMQCLSFCLFGVFGVSATSKIEVQQPEKCKTNCPACSRVCPEVAIIFPKYKAGPINGEEVNATDAQREKVKVDISALLGGDIYSLLRERSERSKSRFSKERDASTALKERQRCLAKLIELGDIPPEVLASLPSPEEIKRRADEASAKAKAALEKQ